MLAWEAYQVRNYVAAVILLVLAIDAARCLWSAMSHWRRRRRDPAGKASASR